MALVAVVAIALITGCTRPAAAGRLAAALPRRDLLDRHRHAATSSTGRAPDAQGNPVALQARPLHAARERHADQPAGARLGPRRRLQRRRQEQLRAGRRGQHVRQAGLRRRVDQLPAARPGLRRQPEHGPAARSPRSRPSTTPRRRCAGCARTRRSYGVDPTRIGIGGESAGGITATLVGLHSEDVGSSGNPGSRLDGGRLRVGLGRAAERRSSPAPATRPACFFHGTADNVVPSRWSDQTAAKMLDAGVPAWLQHQDGAGHVPWAQYRTLYLEQATTSSTSTLDLAHAAGQPVSAARASEAPAEAAGGEPSGEADAEAAPEAARAGEARRWRATALGRRARRSRPRLNDSGGTITDTSSPSSPAASVNVSPTPTILPFTATAMSRPPSPPPFTWPTTWAGRTASSGRRSCSPAA